MKATGAAIGTGTAVSLRQMAALQLIRKSNLDAGNKKVQSRLAYRSARCPGSKCNGADQANATERPLGVVRLQDIFATEYVGELAVGTRHGSAQSRLRVIFDTGSSDLWVVSDLCKRPPCTNKGHHSFNHSASETYVKPNKRLPLFTPYASGDLRGQLGFDDVRVGPLVARRQALGLISEESGEVFSLQFDGLVGLGFPPLASTTTADAGALPLVDHLMESGALETPLFAFYLHSDPQQGGALLWGGVDERLHEGPLLWFPVVQEDFWALDLIAFRIGDEIFDFSAKKQRVEKPILIVDSGTTFFSAPAKMWGLINRAVGGTSRCTQVQRIPSMVFTLEDASGVRHEIKVPPEAFMVRNPAFADWCLLGVLEMDDLDERPFMIWGEVFMRHYLTAFRRGRKGETSFVGVARSKEDYGVEKFFEEMTS